MHSVRRLLLAQFYYDICEAYRIENHVPHCAMALFDYAWHTNRKIRAYNASVVGASAFLMAQKWSSLSVFKALTISKLFMIDVQKMREVEALLLPSFLSVPELRPDRILKQWLDELDDLEARDCGTRFFHMSLLGALLAQNLSLQILISALHCVHRR